MRWVGLEFLTTTGGVFVVSSVDLGGITVLEASGATLSSTPALLYFFFFFSVGVKD